MKINRQKITNAIMTSTTGFMVVLLSTQGVVTTVSAQAASTNAQTSAAALTEQISGELSRRSTMLSNLDLTTPTGTTTTDTTGGSGTDIDASECQDVPKDLVNKTQSTVDKSQNQITDISKALQSNTSLANAQAQAKSADNAYGNFQIAATQGGVMDTLCQQDKAKGQLDTLIKQAQSLIDQQSSSSGSSSSGSGSGSSSSSSQDMLTQIIQLVAALATIIVSIVALITALINGDYAAAMTIFTTILGQLATSSSVISQAISSVTSLISSLGGSVTIGTATDG